MPRCGLGRGDFSVRVTDPERDQLGKAGRIFQCDDPRPEKTCGNTKGNDAILERDIALGREAQQYLYPRQAPLSFPRRACGALLSPL